MRHRNKEYYSWKKLLALKTIPMTHVWAHDYLLQFMLKLWTGLNSHNLISLRSHVLPLALYGIYIVFSVKKNQIIQVQTNNRWTIKMSFKMNIKIFGSRKHSEIALLSQKHSGPKRWLSKISCVPSIWWKQAEKYTKAKSHDCVSAIS